jgi:hypothetical protein
MERVTIKFDSNWKFYVWHASSEDARLHNIQR